MRSPSQLARLAGASVIITSSSDIKLKTVVDHINSSQNFGGVAPIHTINYSKQPEWDQEVLRVTEGRGADFVLEVSPQTRCVSVRGGCSLSAFISG